MYNFLFAPRESGKYVVIFERLLLQILNSLLDFAENFIGKLRNSGGTDENESKGYPRLLTL